MDLPLALRRGERRPARHRTRERALGLLDIGIRRALAEDDLDDVARHALPQELALQRAVAARLETLTLFDPVARERLVIDVALRAQTIDGALDVGDIETLAAQVARDLVDGLRTRCEVADRDVVRVGGRRGPRAGFLHR